MLILTTIPSVAFVLGAQVEKTPASESIQQLSKDDKDTRPHDPSGMDIIARQHLNKQTKQSSIKETDPVLGTKITQQTPDPKDTTPSSNSNSTTIPRPKRKADSDVNDVVGPPSDLFKVHKKDKQWKRKQRKVEKMHRWKQEAGLVEPPLRDQINK